MPDCIFCKIVKGEAPSSLELETENVMAFRSIDPAAEIHILIIPKKHIVAFTDIDQKDKEVFFEMLETAQRMVFEKKIDDGYKLIFNGGKHQAIKHLHWHLLGGDLEADRT
jgi:histidine triad (HIT) family protein